MPMAHRTRPTMMARKTQTPMPISYALPGTRSAQYILSALPEGGEARGALRIDGAARSAPVDDLGHLRHGLQRLVLCRLRCEAADMRRGDHLRVARHGGHGHLVGRRADVDRGPG